MEATAEPLLAEAARLYRGTGRYHWHFARSKMRRDPVYLGVLRGGWLPGRGLLLDLGCGRGLLLALLSTARTGLELRGIERREDHARVAQRALAGRARVEQGDIVDAAFPACSAAAALDVLHYLDERSQIGVLRRAVAALEPGGVLLVRDADAKAGLAFQLTRCAERALEILRGRPASRLHYRSAGEWRSLLTSLGLTVKAEPMSEGTPFANVLFVCTKSA